MDIDKFIECIKLSWSKETSQAHDNIWLSSNPAKGQCAVTSMILMKYLPNSTLIRAVVADQGEAIVHYWLKLEDGSHLDITKSQFSNPHILMIEENPDTQFYVFAETLSKRDILERRALALYGN